MATSNLYPKYNDPSQIVWRKGDVTDPYIPLVEEKKIVNNILPLFEIPDQFTHVVIDGFNEVFSDPFGNDPILTETQFKVNYANGMVTFHDSQNGNTIQASYLGRGYILYPAERIYVHAPNPYAVSNLQEFIELTETKIADVNEAIGDAEVATDNANQSAENANSKAQYAEEQGDRVDGLMDRANFLLDDTEEALININDATQLAIEEKDKLIVARQQTVLIWQQSVSDYTSLLATYPTPDVGWAVMLESSGIIYRYNGADWVALGNMTVSTPLVSETTDGLMTVTDYLKLRDIESGAQVNLSGEDAKDVLPQYFKTKTIVFILAGVLVEGMQDPIIRFPYVGTIRKITASCESEGADNTFIDVLRLTKAEFTNKDTWRTILLSPIQIPFGERIDDGLVTITTNEVTKDDYFKLNVTNVGMGVTNALVEIEIEI